ncbi:uncharacterized protein [Ptychodera flava]|uniref:uncharacterized protein n=1 Tax=Ptychodera flava TaxID=63121 RepID=UPI003969CFCA
MAEKDYNINIPKSLQNHGMVVHPRKTLCGSDDTLTILFLDALLRDTRKYIVKFITSSGSVATAEGVRLNEYILSVRLPKELPAGSTKINVYKPGTVTTHLGECTLEILRNLDMVCDLLQQSLKPEKILSREVNVRPDKFKSFYEILADAQRTIRNTGESAALDLGDFCDQYPTDTARTLELYSFADVFQTSKKRYHPRPKRKYDSVHTGVHLSDVSVQVSIPQAEESFENSSFINEMVNMRKKKKLPPIPAYPMPTYDGASITSMHLTDDWPMNYSVGTHTTGIFDSRGGFLFIQDTGVELFIPPGAIEQGKQQEVSIQLDRRPQNAPALGQGECLVSPVVMCKPSGLNFKVAVVLSFPLFVCGTTLN